MAIQKPQLFIYTSRMPPVLLTGLKVILLQIMVFLPAAATACGWWGDGEMNRQSEGLATTPGGESISQVLNQQTAKLPGKMGYAIAVPHPGQAIPYLQATYGRRVNQIGDLKTFGFKAVIDVGTTAKIARLHQAETEAAGMSYFNVSVEGDMSTAKQAILFSRMVLETDHGTLLVYASTPSLLEVIWASHRINPGAPVDFAISEGKSLGMTQDQAAELRKRLNAG